MTTTTKPKQVVSTPMKAKQPKARVSSVSHDMDDEFDKQIDCYAADGKFDQFAEEAMQEHRAGKTRPVPS